MLTKAFPIKILVGVTIFSIAMGFLETSVVVYLRALLYPHGFVFPLAPIPHQLALTEIFREAATLIMLLGIGILAGRNVASRFAWFIYSFAIWDIFYYVFLKLILNWPESWMTWDILFLIPSTWVGPVITPVIVSITMILLALSIIYHNSRQDNVHLKPIEWMLLIVGSIMLILGFMWDYSAFILEKYRNFDIWDTPSADLLNLALTYIPRKFNWILFCSGEIVILSGIFTFWKRSRQYPK